LDKLKKKEHKKFSDLEDRLKTLNSHMKKNWKKMEYFKVEMHKLKAKLLKITKEMKQYMEDLTILKKFMKSTRIFLRRFTKFMDAKSNVTRKDS